jgi:hypothetical protein
MAATFPLSLSDGFSMNGDQTSLPFVKSTGIKSHKTDSKALSSHPSDTLKDGLKKLESSFNTLREESELNAAMEEALGNLVNEFKSFPPFDTTKQYEKECSSSTMVNFMLKTIEKQQEQIEEARVQLDKERQWRTMAVSWMQRHLNTLKLQPTFHPASCVFSSA